MILLNDSGSPFRMAGVEGHRSDPHTQVATVRTMASVGGPQEVANFAPVVHDHDATAYSPGVGALALPASPLQSCKDEPGTGFRKSQSPNRLSLIVSCEVYDAGK
jgi:hypothetical protein